MTIKRDLLVKQNKEKYKKSTDVSGRRKILRHVSFAFIALTHLSP
jgi:hypothetical protein